MPSKGYIKNRAGEKHITNEGYAIEIIESFNAKNCTIRFESGVIIKNRGYSDLLKGKVKNPYHKSFCEVGYFGIGNYNNKTNCKAYNIWGSMLRRCYNGKLQERQPTYKDVTVCEEWHNFQNFAQWFENNYKEEFDLDKDILVKGNKIYSPETCCFVPQEINGLLVKRQNDRGKYPIGVIKKRNKFQASININGKAVNLGVFYTMKEAFQAYKTAKEKYIKEMADKWKDKITEQTYQALINYKVEITD